ncbi:hypothetical protein DFR58_102164 [Anaerobacterium chartisolvens]|uniref:Butirosin biosynthesis protein H-like n=1 Tax=Anaerobacterium chartisolvens TaxID=1297424 RepID=A0A369BFQ8_9FIRM|nr:hypothetical protein [Anaerobacterium chartisolvens]RCX20095.1 hypothetical protein DFR58_102164 [Anaerobacterium chartisolvens]
MRTKIELENIEPFCEAWYIDCFYNLVFSVLKHFNKDIRELLVNDIFLYKYSKNSLTMTVKSIRPLNELQNDIGIAVEEIAPGENLIVDFTELLSKGSPLIVLQDLYFASYRNEFYMKNHHLHTVLLYGFDKDEKYFNIVEQSFMDSYFYKKMYASFSDIFNACEGAFNNFSDKAVSNMGFYLKDPSAPCNRPTDLNIYRQKLIENYLKHKSEVEESIIHIENFYNDFKDIILREALFWENVDSIIENCNLIISNKKADLYKYIKLFDSQPELKLHLIESIINEWETIRGLLLKLRLTMSYKMQLLNSSMNRINNIIRLEHEFHNEFNKFAEKTRGNK